jgi:hypothetical protein
MAEILTRLRLALRVLAGRAVMYRVKVLGPITVMANLDVVIAECVIPRMRETKEGNNEEREIRV